MCGICGYISRKRITEEQLRAMNDTMYHRGPDDGGAEIYEMRGGWQVGFAQRRLSRSVAAGAPADAFRGQKDFCRI